MSSRTDPHPEPEPIPARLWVGDDPPAALDTLDVQAHSELTDVDEVAVILRWGDDDEDVTLYLDRVHAIALAGEIAKAATTTQGALPRGHVEDM